MTRVTGQAAFNAFLLAVALLLLGLTVGMGPSARLVPLIVVVPLAALLAYRLVRDIVAQAPNGNTSMTEAPVTQRAEFAMIGWLFALALLATVLGFVLGPGLFVLAWLSYRGRERFVVSLTCAVVAGVAVWLVFERVLGVPLPLGVWSALLNG
ncbi:MAG: tripartite tricarboxylate transporter TctB family protein [Gemmatimonadota bacterium]